MANWDRFSKFDILGNMKTEHIEYDAIAILGLEAVARKYCGRTEFTGLVCHRGNRRAPAAVKLLIAAGHPVANRPDVIPTLNYADLTEVHFTVSGEGLYVHNKMDVACRNIMVFHDGSDEEERSLKIIKNFCLYAG